MPIPPGSNTVKLYTALTAQTVGKFTSKKPFLSDILPNLMLEVVVHDLKTAVYTIDDLITFLES